MSPLFTFMAVGTALLNAAFALGIVMLFKKEWRARLQSLCRTHGRLIILFLALCAVLGSLAIEFIAHLPPCVFCWWQRVFMYPILVISGIAFVKNVDLADIADYIIGLSIFGAGFALYQHFLQMLPQGSLIPCSANDECAIRSIFEFGYITLPWMALSMFAVIILIAILARKKELV